MKFPYDDLWYLKGCGPGKKNPMEAWGGYGTPLADNPNVYCHEDVEMFPHKHWLVNGIADSENMSHKLLVFDLDIYKAPEGFDPDRITVPNDTAIVKTQSGGLHVYFAVSTPEGGKEADFQTVDGLPFDIDIRGEYVKHHVVAPSEVPGVSTGYELVNDESITHVFDPAEAAQSIKLDGEPALRHKPGNSAGGGYDRDEIDPPSNMPKCYGAALSLRKKAPEDNNLNTHKVNVHAALCGLASGYSTEAVIDHFVEDYYPGDPAEADRERTTYHINHIAQKLDNGDYSPTSVATLQEYGILPAGEHCYCGLPGHSLKNKNKSDYYNEGLEGIARAEGYGNPFEDEMAMLKSCLKAREETDLGDAKPPYSALLGVAEVIGLEMKDEDEQILGERNYNIARRVFDDLAPGEV